MTTPKTRFWEIDFTRGIAMLMMLIYHFLVDLEFISGQPFNLDYGFWSYFQKTTACLFLVIAGISLNIAYQTGRLTFKKNLGRGLTIFGWGLAITVVTRFALPEGYIIFGVLHLIGISTILAYPLLQFKYVNLAFGGMILMVGYFLDQTSFPFSSLVWLGFVPRRFYSLDYFPLLPWFGLILIGIYLGNVLYPGNQPLIVIRSCTHPIIRLIATIGQYSLPVYLIHQPLILASLYLAFQFFKP